MQANRSPQAPTFFSPSAVLALISALVLVLALAAPSAGAQATALDLDSAVGEAQGKSPEVQRAKAVAEEALGRRAEAFGAGFLPRISATASHAFDNRFIALPVPGLGSFNEAMPSSMLELDASLPLFDGFAGRRRLEAADANGLAAQRDLEFAEFALAQHVRLAFFQARAAELISDVFDQNVKTLEEHLRLVQLLFRNGAATDYDMLRVEVQLNEARSDALEARDNVDLDRRKLTQAMGNEDDARPLHGELPIPNEKALAGARLEPGSAKRADLEALDLRAGALAKVAKADDAYLIPKLSLAASYQYYNIIDRSFDNGYFKDAYTVGATLTWNIFDGDVSRSRARVSAAQRTQAEKATRQAKLQLPYDLEKWRRKYLSGFNRYRVRTLDVKKSQDEVTLARQEQKAGARTSSEVLDAEVDMFKAKAGAVNAQLAAAEAYLQLELALGRKL